MPYPIHNFGTDPIGKLGVSMIESSLDWDNKQKALEKKSIYDALEGQRGMYKDIMNAGGDVSGASRFYTPDLVNSMQEVSKRNAELKQNELMTSKLTQAEQSAKLGTAVATAFDKVYTVSENFAISQQKLIDNLADLSSKGLVPESKVAEAKTSAFNAIQSMFKVSPEMEKYLPVIQEGINSGQIKQAFKTVLGSQISEQSQILYDPSKSMEEKAKAFGMMKTLVSNGDFTADERKTYLGGAEDAFKAALQESLTKPKEPPKKSLGEVRNYQQGDRNVSQELVGYDENNQPIYKTLGTGPKFKANAPEKPEYSPKQALSRISTIDSTIARLQSSGTFDTAMAIQNPQLAALLGSKDPESINNAIATLKNERDYVSQFAPGQKKVEAKPAGIPAPAAKTSAYKTADDVKAAYQAKKISKDEAAKVLRSRFGYK